MPYLTTEWGNPSSAYRFGSKLKSVIENAREQVVLCEMLRVVVPDARQAVKETEALKHAAAKEVAREARFRLTSRGGWNERKWTREPLLLLGS